MGGCLAGHVPWYVFFLIEERFKCGGALINKFWVLSAAHCFCEKFPCSRVSKAGDSLMSDVWSEVDSPRAGPAGGEWTIT